MKDNPSTASLSDRKVFVIYAALFLSCIFILTKYKSFFFESFLDKSDDHALYINPQTSSNNLKAKINISSRQKGALNRKVYSDNHSEQNLLNGSAFPATIIHKETQSQTVQSNIILAENYSTGRTHTQADEGDNEDMSNIKLSVIGFSTPMQSVGGLQLLADNSNSTLAEVNNGSAQLISSPDPGDDPGAEEMIPVTDGHCIFVALLVGYAIHIYHSRKRKVTKDIHIQ